MIGPGADKFADARKQDTRQPHALKTPCIDQHRE